MRPYIDFVFYEIERKTQSSKSDFRFVYNNMQLGAVHKRRP